MAEYAPNSHRSKELQEDENNGRKVEKVVTGNVKTKKNDARKLTDAFISEDASNVKSYILMDVLIPAIKKAISDIVTDGIDMILYGGTKGSKRDRGTSKVSYRSYYDDRRSESRDQVSTRFDYDDILFESRGDAELVREQMVEIIDQYGVVTVADMYDMAGKSVPYTGNRYGWTNIRNAEIVRVRGGDYIIKLPKAMPID